MGTVVKFRNIARDTKANTGYRWKDKDPIMDIVAYVMDESGMAVWQVAEKSGVAISTILAWRKGKTRKPQHKTVRAVLEACGYSSLIRRDSDNTITRVGQTRRNWRFHKMRGGAR